MSSAHVTDHAVIRYLELAYGMNFEFYRDRVAELAKTAIKEGASGVTVEGVKFVIRNGRVTSVIQPRQNSRDYRSGRIEEVLRTLQPTDPDLASMMIRRPGEVAGGSDD